MNVKPARAIGWTAVGALLALLSPSVMFDFAVAISIMLLLIVTTRSIKAARSFLSLSIPFFVPLLVIHGIINPQFEQSYLFSGLPVRMEGVRFALNICSNLSIFLAVAIGWWHVERDYFVDWLIARKVPTVVLGVIALASAMVPLIERRGAAVLRAQTARGIPTGPKLRHRLKAMPSILLPVITSLMNEADHRSYALWSRGFGQYQFSGENVPFGHWPDLVYVLAVAILPLLVVLIG